MMPAVRDALQGVWPQASPLELESVRDGRRPIVQNWLASTDCDAFTSLAEAGLVEATDSHLTRDVACADDENRNDGGVPSSVAPAPTPTPAPASSSIPISPTERMRQASAGLQASHNMWVNMSSVLTENHVGTMNAIVNMGPSMDYHFVVTKP